MHALVGSFLFSCQELEHLHCTVHTTSGAQHPKFQSKRNIHSDPPARTPLKAAPGVSWESVDALASPPSLQEAGDFRLQVPNQLLMMEMTHLLTAQVKGAHAENVQDYRPKCDSSFKDQVMAYV